MAFATGMTPSPVMSELLTQGYEFSFVQVMRLARRFLDPRGEEGLPVVPWQDRVRVRPELSLAFPASDVAQVETDGSHLRITATFLALYGSSSPLPNFYSEDLMDEASSDESVLRDFVDIIHQRLYHLYFQCWSKYRLFVRVVEENNPVDRERLLCLIGLGEKELAASVADSFSLLRYTGILSQFPRSALGLATILRDALFEPRIRIIQNVRRMVPIPKDQRMCMGLSGCRLGVDTVLGSEIVDRMGKIRISVGPVSWEEYNNYLPSTDWNERLAEYVRFYLVDPLAVDMHLVLAAGEAKPIQLGDPKARLGLNTWCFSGDTLGEVSAAFQVPAFPFKAPSGQTVACNPSANAGRSLADYYQQERAVLGELAIRFVEQHENLASLMSGPKADPGIERLFEGTAFLNALLQRKLDDDFPEFIHPVMDTLQPHCLKPVPATTIVAFTPKEHMTQPLTVSAGAQVDSVPVRGTKCRFRSCFDISVHPVKITNARYIEPSGKLPVIVLDLELNQMPLSAWQGDSLRLFLSGTYRHASDTYLMLMRYLKQITITTSGNYIRLPAGNLKPFGFDRNETILAGENCHMPGHLVLQEYFLFPEKYLFLDLHGMDKCRLLGESASCMIEFELASTLPYKPTVGANSFALHAVPAINLFEHKARPILLDRCGTQSRISVSGSKPENYRIYSVDKVSAFNKIGSGKTLYGRSQKEIHDLAGNTNYCLSYIQSNKDEGYDTCINLPALQDASSGYKTKIDIDLTCSNGTLAEQLGPGDVCVPASTTPEPLQPSNISQVTHYASSGIQPNRQWKLLSILILNGTSLGALPGIKAALKELAITDNRNHAAFQANIERIEAIESIEIKQSDRILSGKMYRGCDIRLKLHAANFSGPGDLYLFACAFERFLGGYVSAFCYIRMSVEDTDGSHQFEWPARFGDKSVV